MSECPTRPEPEAAGLSSADLDRLRSLLLRGRELLRGDVQSLEDEARRKDAAGDVSTLPIHLADAATDDFERDLSLSFMERDTFQLREIEDALERLESGSYGRCEGCDKPIGVERLKALPSARLCMGCQIGREAQAA
jgi:RNA polymerase-binding protein DksA